MKLHYNFKQNVHHDISTKLEFIPFEKSPLQSPSGPFEPDIRKIRK